MLIFQEQKEIIFKENNTKIPKFTSFKGIYLRKIDFWLEQS